MSRSPQKKAPRGGIPGLRPVAIFDEIRQGHPEIGAGIRHTLERRVAPSRISSSGRSIRRAGLLSDFTDMRDRITDVLLDHRLYHFRLAFSGWEHAHIVLGVECFVALAEGCRTHCGRSVGLRYSSEQPVGRVRQSRCQ